METTLRKAELSDLVALLNQQRDIRYDVVATADRIRFDGGSLVVKDGATAITEEGVGTADAVLSPTTVFDGGIADRLGIPSKYLRRMRDENQLPLLDANVNTWLGATPGRRFLIRGFLGDGSTDGIARACLSNAYGVTDNLDLLLGVLGGARSAGVGLDVISADISERRMRVRVACPEVAALAPVLLAGYRSPFDGADPDRVRALEAHGWLKPEDRPVVHAGFVLGNSETGHGGWFLAPEFVVKACTNGLTIKADKIGGVHLGARMDEGVIDWSEDVRRKNLELIVAQAKDAVERFVSPAYIEAKLAEIEEKAGAKVAEPTSVLERVGKQFNFSKDEQDAILADFISGGQLTSGGVMQAVTSVAQRITDPDRAGELSDVALDVLEFAAAIAD